MQAFGAADDRFKALEANYRLLFDNNPRPMWVYDTDSLAFLAVNDAAIEKYGYSREEFLSMTLKDIRPKEEVDVLMDNLANVPLTFENATDFHHQTTSDSLLFCLSDEPLMRAFKYYRSEYL